MDNSPSTYNLRLGRDIYYAKYNIYPWGSAKQSPLPKVCNQKKDAFFPAFDEFSPFSIFSLHLHFSILFPWQLVANFSPSSHAIRIPPPLQTIALANIIRNWRRKDISFQISEMKPLKRFKFTFLTKTMKMILLNIFVEV